MKRTSFRKYFFLLFFSLISTAFASAQIKVTGTVTDSKTNETMIGLTIKVKGTDKITITDIDGKYEIVVPNSNSVLVYTYTGYHMKEEKVGDRTVVNVAVEENAKLLDEVVVVGFTTQKKANLTGAISTISSEALENKPVANIGQALQGLVPNLNITMSSGAPNTAPSFNIRGGTSLVKKDGNYVIQDGAPLILLDGVEISGDQLNQINPNDIDNMSFLKDASSGAIYGTRAAFGVILVQTKKGDFQQKAKISYSYDVSWDKPAALPDLLSSADIYQSQLNKKLWNDGVAPVPTELEKLEYMKAYIANPRPENAYYMSGSTINWVANTRPYDLAIKDWTPTQKHNLSVSGGGGGVSYYISLGYQDQDGMYKIGEDNFKRYNAMVNLNASPTKWFKFGTKVSYNSTKYSAPNLPGGKGSIWSAMRGGEYDRNIFMPVMTGPNDPIPNAPTENFLALFEAGGRSKSTSTTTILSFNPEFIIIPKELSIKADLSFKPITYRYSSYTPKQYRVNNSWDEEAMVRQHSDENRGTVTKSSTDEYAINLYATYNKTFKKEHNLDLLLGLNQERMDYTQSSISMEKLLSPNMLNPQAVEDVTLNTSSTARNRRTNRAVFGKIGYNFKQRYIVDMYGRYDGSSKFTKDDRYQFFPTFAAAWRIAEEDFMASTRGWLDNLKLKFSWGKLGDQPGDYYPYQAIMDSGFAGFLLDGGLPSGVAVPQLVADNLKWQSSTSYNYGIDITALNNRIDFSFEYYERTTKDILTDGTIVYPGILGATAPKENSGEIKTYGFEMSAKWRDRLANGLGYGVGVTLADNQTKVLTYTGNRTNSLGSLRQGQKIGDIWGYTTGGIMQEEDMYKVKNAWYYNGAYHNNIYSSGFYPGYVWLQDINGDGIINNGEGTSDKPGDQKKIGNSRPRYNYSITADVSYKGFDLSVFFQGVGKRDAWISSSSYWGGNNAGSQYMYDRSWTPERTNAKYPQYGSSIQTQTGYLFDASYLRLKQVSLGYTVPINIVKRIGLEKLRFTVSGYNLFEITDIPNMFDVDQISDTYPQKRTIALGAQIVF